MFHVQHPRGRINRKPDHDLDLVEADQDRGRISGHLLSVHAHQNEGDLALPYIAFKLLAPHPPVQQLRYFLQNVQVEHSRGVNFQQSDKSNQCHGSPKRT